jgi:methyltransferase
VSASYVVYYTLIAAVCAERVAELVVAKRNAAWSFARGGVEYGFAHYPPMVVLHTGLLVGCIVEPLAGHRTFVAWLGWPMIAVELAAQAPRWWCISTLGTRWNTRVIVVPGLPLLRTGPYRLAWLKHPNYVAVVVEGVALPLAGSAWITAAVFTVLNAVLLTVRIRCEAGALATLPASAEWSASGASADASAASPAAPSAASPAASSEASP